MLPEMRIEHSTTEEHVRPLALGMVPMREQGVQQGQPEPVTVQEGLTGQLLGLR
jgi:hypothetical protein